MPRNYSIVFRAAMGIFLQARPPQWWPHQQHAAAAATVFYSAKSKQGLGLGGFASSGGPGFDRSAYPKVVKEVCLISHLNRKKSI